MEVVIKLSDYDYFAIKNGGLYAIGHDRLDTVITEAVNKGSVLPAGHGDLIDAAEFDKLLRKYGLDYEADSFIPEAETIIPADSEE